MKLKVFCFFFSKKKCLLCLIVFVCTASAHAEGLNVKIGVITDMAGSLASQWGEGSVVATKWRLMNVWRLSAGA